MNRTFIQIEIMKTSTLLLCLATFSAFGQDDIAPVEAIPPVPPRPAIPAVAPVPPMAPIPAIPAITPLPALKAIAQVVDASAGAALAQAKEAVEKAKATALAQADIAFQIGKEAPGGIFFRRSTKPGRTLIVPGKEIEASASRALEEDLNVMARILEKAIERKSEDDGPKAMGIDVFSSSSSSGVRNLYLDGYGAVFILNIRFPLTPPPDKAEQSKTNEPASSEWADAWDDVYGSRGEWGVDFGKGLPKDFGSPKSFGSSTEEYDADKVENLNVSVLEALRNATNIRNLKSDEKVTVVVTSSAGSVDVKKKRVTAENRSARGGGSAVEVRESERRADGSARSALTIHAKKSDIDSFAKGKLTLDEFRKKATVALY